MASHSQVLNTDWPQFITNQRKYTNIICLSLTPFSRHASLSHSPPPQKTFQIRSLWSCQLGTTWKTTMKQFSTIMVSSLTGAWNWLTFTTQGWTHRVQRGEREQTARGEHQTQTKYWFMRCFTHPTGCRNCAVLLNVRQNDPDLTRLWWQHMAVALVWWVMTFVLCMYKYVACKSIPSYYRISLTAFGMQFSWSDLQ